MVLSLLQEASAGLASMQDARVIYVPGLLWILMILKSFWLHQRTLQESYRMIVQACPSMSKWWVTSHHCLTRSKKCSKRSDHGSWGASGREQGGFWVLLNFRLSFWSHWCVSRREWGLLGYAGMTIHSCYWSFPHSLRETHQSVIFFYIFFVNLPASPLRLQDGDVTLEEFHWGAGEPQTTSR